MCGPSRPRAGRDRHPVAAAGTNGLPGGGTGTVIGLTLLLVKIRNASLCGILAVAAALALPAPPATAQMTPGAPVKNFRLPRFADNGYTQWVLRGGEGIYESEERIRVLEMELRVYSADERMTKEMSMESPEALLLVKRNRAVSDSDLRIRGAAFDLSGRVWRWDGDTKVIEIDEAVEVRFREGAEGAPGEDGAGAEPTVITSDRLRLQTTEEDYRFIFSGGVEARSGEITIRCEALLAFAEAPGRVVEAARIEAIDRLLARGDVVIEQGGLVAHAGEAEFFPDRSRAELRERPRIELPGAHVSGGNILLEPGHAEVTGGEAGRARTVLSRAGEFGLGGSGALASETVILADSTVMDAAAKGAEGNRFQFAGAVELVSGELTLTSDQLVVETTGAIEPGEAGGAVETGAVRRAVARGGVRIERAGLVATGDEAIFHPVEERSILTGHPRVEGEGSTVEAERLELMPGGAKAESAEGREPVRVRLPPLPDLGYALGGPATGEPASAPDADAADAPERPSRPTLVRSREARVFDEEGGQRFVFTRSVEVEATNLDVTCERLEVSTIEGPKPAGEEGPGTLDIRRIEASGGVVVSQEGRDASAERALVLPEEGRLVLEGDALVEDERGRASGERLTLLRGERRAIVEGNKEEGRRARISLPGPRE